MRHVAHRGSALGVLALALSGIASAVQAQAPLIDNPRVTARKITLTPGQPGVLQKHDTDFVMLTLAGGTIRTTMADGKTHVSVRKFGDAVFGKKGTEDKNEVISASPAQLVEVDLKDFAVPPRANKSGYPDGFPRKGARNTLENDRVATWVYTWQYGPPTFMHYHGRDIVGVFRYDGQVKSTPPDGKATLVTYKAGEVRFTPGDRVHSETLMSGRESAILMELK